MDDIWFECLLDHYKWIKNHKDDLLYVANTMLDTGDLRYITGVHQSSVWAVCHAYIDYRLGTSFLSPQELGYTQGRGGVIGVCFCNGGVKMLTIRQFFEAYDPGFITFMSKHKGPPAA